MYYQINKIFFFRFQTLKKLTLDLLKYLDIFEPQIEFL